MTDTMILVFVIGWIILSAVALHFGAKSDLKRNARINKERDRLYQEATEWYNQLPAEKKADIMDILWDSCPSPKNGKKYMISIYQYYTQTEKELWKQKS